MRAIDIDYEVIFEEPKIRRRVEELGRLITTDYSGKDLVVLGVLKGSVVFLSDLIRVIDLPIRLDFLSVSSYGSNMKSSGTVAILRDFSIPIEGRDVLLVEDIVDTGLTLSHVVQCLMTRQPSSVRICAFLDKKEARSPGLGLTIDYVGFEVPNRFIVGYGLDCAEKYRNLPFIAAISGVE